MFKPLLSPFQTINVPADWFVMFSLIQASTVSGPVMFKLGESATTTQPPLPLVPLKLNAWPTLPGANAALPCNDPELGPTMS